MVRTMISLLVSGGLSLSLASGLSSCSQKEVSAASVDGQAVLPTGAPAKALYARYYLLATVSSFEDTPYFTTSEAFALAQPRRFWVAVYVLRNGSPQTDPPGFQVLDKADQMPMEVHGGCRVINLVADAHSGETLLSWCNVDGQAPDGAPHQIPVFRSPSSPFA